MQEIFNSKLKKRRSISADKAAYRLTFLALAMAAMPFTASAAAIMTEIMYDVSGTDTGREWIEIQNTGDSAIDLSTLKIFEANTNHKITALASSSIPSGSFAVIADNPDKFRADNPNFSGLLFDSAFSLSNDGETLSIRDESGADIDTVSYLPSWGAAGDAYSIQKSVTGVWVSGPTTPGLPTVVTQSFAPPGISEEPSVDLPTTNTTSILTQEDSDSLSVHSAQEIANTSGLKAEFEITAGRPRLGFVGAPLSFESRVKTSKGVAVGSRVRSLWSLGDGTQLFGDVISHAYMFAGDYVVIANSDSNGDHAVAKVSVKIVEPRVRLSLSPEGEAVVLNLDRGDLNIGGFIIADAARRFSIPPDTIIRANGSLKLSPALTKMRPPKEYIELIDPSGKAIAGVNVSVREPLILLPAGLDAEILKERLVHALQAH